LELQRLKSRKDKDKATEIKVKREVEQNKMSYNSPDKLYQGDIGE
jgi:hypothetical protein